MSYRAFKRLLGETSLERKCRFLFGGFTVLLITGSFWLYARQTERLAYNQITTTACRLLVKQIVDNQLATRCRAGVKGTPAPPAPPGKGGTREKPAVIAEPPDGGSGGPPDRMDQAIEEFREQWEKHWPQALQQYHHWTTRPDALDQDHLPDQATLERLKEFEANPNKHEDNRLALSQGKSFYYGAVRASKSCLECHQRLRPDLAEGDLLAVITIEVPTDSIAEGFHYNRALLITTALGTALFIMGGSYLIVRYVIVKPVKHLKDVSDAISAGQLNVRSEIQTGDEFEDLSHAFNRMLRTWHAMQERLRTVNSDLDRKVDELAQANLALYESNRLKSDFLATMSHELRTPLHSILGFSEVLLSADGLTDKQKRWANNIQSSGQQLLNLINDVLDLAKIEAGKMQVRLVEFCARDVCEGLLNMFRPLAEKKNIDLRGVYAPQLPMLRQDLVKFQQIVSNLLSNAVKFTPEGGRVLLRANVDSAPARPGVPGTDLLTTPRSPPNPETLILTVTDTGVGIPPEEQDRIFEKFRQADRPLTREHTGTGLGLSIVRELARLLGGEVTLQSELGRGSTFTLRLPLRLSPEPRLEFDLAHEGIDLSKAQRIDVPLYAKPSTTWEFPLSSLANAARRESGIPGETRSDPTFPPQQGQEEKPPGME
jgi:two-component system sensor histidine kinase BarA